MNDFTTALLPVIFRGATLYVADVNGEPYVPMRPIVEGMGLDWASQFTKLKGSRFDTTVVEITTVAEDGKQRLMTCMPLRKLPGWLMSIHANKVRADLRERIVQYQNECDDVLWRHWQNRAGGPSAEASSERACPEFTVEAIVDLVDGSGAELAVRVPIGGMPGYVHVLFAWNGERAPVSYFMALEAFDALGVPYPLEALRARQDVGLRLDTRQTLAVAAQLRLAVLDQSVRANQAWFESLYDGMVLLQPAELEASIAAYPAAVDVVRGATSAASRFVTAGTQAARTAMQTIRGSRLRTRRSRKDRTAELAAAVRMWNASAARRRRMSLRGTDHA